METFAQSLLICREQIRDPPSGATSGYIFSGWPVMESDFHPDGLQVTPQLLRVFH